MYPLKPHTQRIIEAEIDDERRKRNADPERPKERIAITDQKALLNVDPRRILTGDVEVYDDRKPRPR
jgi:hypothetical protein